MRPFTGAWGGAMLAIALCIAYDTSSNVSLLEGATRGHLRFRAILAAAAIGALIGFFAGALGWAAETRRQTARRIREQSLTDA